MMRSKDKALVNYFFDKLIPKGVNLDYILSLEDSELIPFLPRITPKDLKEIIQIKEAYTNDHNARK